MHISGMGCGRCIGACAFDAIENINGNAPELLGRKMAEYTAAVVNERPDKNFCIGIQFHPEVAVRKYVDKEKDAETFMDYDTALSFFRALIDASHGAS